MNSEKIGAVERALARRQRGLNVTQGFLRGIERAAVRRARLNRLAERAGFEGPVVSAARLAIVCELMGLAVDIEPRLAAL